MAEIASAPPYRFCPVCGGSLDERVIKADEPARLVCSACGFVLYRNPKVAACAICLLNGRIVLVKRAIEPALGKWVFPGGFVDLGETVQDAAIRETYEEANLRVTLTGILDAYSFPGHDIVVVVYAADVLGGELRAGEECSDIHTFKPEDVPWDELAFPSTLHALRDYLRRFFPRVRVPRG
jgi:ADP-ribose pyrophosphatase YjhB (NUDIX family)